MLFLETDSFFRLPHPGADIFNGPRVRMQKFSPRISVPPPHLPDTAFTQSMSPPDRAASHDGSKCHPGEYTSHDGRKKQAYESRDPHEANSHNGYIESRDCLRWLDQIASGMTRQNTMSKQNNHPLPFGNGVGDRRGRGLFEKHHETK